MMTIDRLLEKLDPASPILQATFGLERESLRVTEAGTLASTPHPSSLGSRSFHPYIQTDFSEQQLELITPIASSTQEARRLLGAITDVAGRSIPKDELMWPLSMPPQLREDEIEIAHLENTYELRYRQGLAEKYGKRLQTISGIHYNIELGKDLMTALFEASDFTSLKDFKNALYLKLARNFLHFRWFLTYLYGAAPLAETGFYDKQVEAPVRSLRNSQHGYVNEEHVHVSFSSLESYVSDIEAYVNSGDLSAEKEFYSPVRFRGQKRNRDYLEQGITYLELRCFDLNPFDVLGISQETLDAVHLFLLALLWLDDLTDSDAQLQAAYALNDAIALAHPLTPLPAEADSSAILQAMENVIQHFNLPDAYRQLLAQVSATLAEPKLTLAGQLLPHIEKNSLSAFGLAKAKKYRDYAWTAPYALKGYESMELSTQMLMFDALQKGLHLDILDENDQFLKLWHGQHVEYVKNGNMTSKDNYVIPLAMANKTVTKKILAAADFPVPAGAEFSSL